MESQEHGKFSFHGLKIGRILPPMLQVASCKLQHIVEALCGRDPSHFDLRSEVLLYLPLVEQLVKTDICAG